MQAARPIRGPHGGWQKQEIDALRQSIEAAEQSGESLRSVFDRMSRQLGRKPNSIRNFYYAQVRAEQGEGGARATPFETFSKEEVERLVEQVLTAKAQGVSVRACVQQLAGGDRTRRGYRFAVCDRRGRNAFASVHGVQPRSVSARRLLYAGREISRVRQSEGK